MFNELSNAVSEFYKCHCQDVFFDVLSSELNLDGVIYFYQNTIGQVVKDLEKHFWPIEHQINASTYSHKMDYSVQNVLRKKYQSNWRQIFQNVISKKYCDVQMQKIQAVLAIADNENEDINQQISDFIK